jgi:hypothetical protein
MTQNGFHNEYRNMFYGGAEPKISRIRTNFMKNFETKIFLLDFNFSSAEWLFHFISSLFEHNLCYIMNNLPVL